MKLIRRLLLSDKNPATYGELGGALRHPKMQAVLICMGAPALLAYLLWSRYFGPYYAVGAGIGGSFAGLAFLMWEVSRALSEENGDQSGGGSSS